MLTNKEALHVARNTGHWCNAPTAHESECPARDGFGDWYECACGLDEFWRERKVPCPACDRIRDVLSAHYLAGIECDHEARTDRAACACSMVALPVCSTVGGAVQSWIDHVMDVLRTAHPQNKEK